MAKTYKLPGEAFGFEGEREYKLLDRVPHRIFSGFAAYRDEEKVGEAMSFLLTEMIIEGPVPGKKAGTWKQGKLTNEYLKSDSCDAGEMRLLMDLILEDYQVFQPESNDDLIKKVRKLSA